MNWNMSCIVFLILYSKASSLFFSSLQSSMEWPGDFPEDHAFVDLRVPGVSSELDFEQLLKDTEEKLKLNANRSVRVAKAVNCSSSDS